MTADSLMTTGGWTVHSASQDGEDYLRGELMAELEDQLAALEIEYNELLTEAGSTPRLPYANIETELRSFDTELVISDPSLDGLSSISESSFKLNNVRYRAGELYSQAINSQAIWNILTDKLEGLYEDVKNVILINDKETQEKKNQALQIASVNSKPLAKLVLKLFSVVKTEYAMVQSNLKRCEEVISKVEFADKCLDKHIKGVNLQTYYNEMPRRTAPLAKYSIKVHNTSGKVGVDLVENPEV